MLSGQRHAPQRPLKQLVRTDNMGAGMHWLGGRVRVGVCVEKGGTDVEVHWGGGSGWGGRENKQEGGMSKGLQGRAAAR